MRPAVTVCSNNGSTFNLKKRYAMGCGASSVAGKAAQHGILDCPQVIIEEIENNPPAGPRPPQQLVQHTFDQQLEPSQFAVQSAAAQDSTGVSPTAKQIFSKRQQESPQNARSRKSTLRVTTSSTGPYMNTLEEKFPGAIPEDFFIQQATDILERHGFTPNNAINLVSTCRDEICRSFTLELDRLWGPSFSISSLAGMVFCGRTGFKAAMAHSPVIGGKERYVFWVMPHIGLSNDGLFGRFAPPFDHPSTSTCAPDTLLPTNRAPQGLPPRP